MASFEITQHVEAAQERTFELFTSFETMHTMIPDIVRIELLTDGPVCAGTRFKETRTWGKREHSEEMEITAFDPPSGISLLCQSCGARYAFDYSFAANGTGTDVTLRAQITPTNFVAKIMMVLMKMMQKKFIAACRKDMEHVAQAAEECETQ